MRNLLLILFCLAFFSKLHADNPCSSFVIKITYYTTSGKQDSGIIYYNNFHDGILRFNPIMEYDTIFHRIRSNQIDYRKIKKFNPLQNAKILAVNKSVMLDTLISSDIGEGYNTQQIIPIASKIYQFSHIDTINYTCYTIQSDYDNGFASLDSSIQQTVNRLDTIHYAPPRFLNFDTVNLIVLDTILWCGDNDQIQWINKKQISNVTLGKVISCFRIYSSNSESFWIDFFSYDNTWTKHRILSSFNLQSIDKNLYESGGDNVFDVFSPALKKAIKTNKILYFVRSDP